MATQQKIMWTKTIGGEKASQVSPEQVLDATTDNIAKLVGGHTEKRDPELVDRIRAAVVVQAEIPYEILVEVRRGELTQKSGQVINWYGVTVTAGSGDERLYLELEQQLREIGFVGHGLRYNPPS